MKKILITGSSGFLGSRLAYLLKDKYDLLLPTHSELNVSHEEAVRAYVEEHIRAAIHEFRGVTNVWEVARNIEKAIQHPFRY